MEFEVPEVLCKQNCYTLRLDCEDNEANLLVLKKVINWLKSKKYLIFYEISSKVKKPHYQGFIYSTRSFKTRKEKKNRTQFFNRLGYKGGSYSMTPVTNYEAYSQYVAKDGNVKLSKGINSDEIEELIRKGKQRSEEIRLYKTLSKKNTKLQLYTQLIKESKCKISFEDMIEVILRYCIANKTLVPSNHLLKQYVLTIYLTLQDDEYSIKAISSNIARSLKESLFWDE